MPWPGYLCSASGKQLGTQKSGPWGRESGHRHSWHQGVCSSSGSMGCRPGKRAVGGRVVVCTTLVPGGEVDWPWSTWRPRSPSASEVPTFLGAADQCSPESLDLGGFSGWHVEELAQWAGQPPQASLWSKPLLSA